MKIFQNKIAFLLWNSANNLTLKLFEHSITIQITNLHNALTDDNLQQAKHNFASRCWFHCDDNDNFAQTENLFEHFANEFPSSNLARLRGRNNNVHVYFPLSNLFTSPDNPAPVCTPLYSHPYILICNEKRMNLRTNFTLNALRSFYCCRFLFVAENCNNNNLID